MSIRRGNVKRFREYIAQTYYSAGRIGELPYEKLPLIVRRSVDDQIRLYRDGVRDGRLWDETLVFLSR